MTAKRSALSQQVTTRLQEKTGQHTTDMGRITLERSALNEHYLPKVFIELALPLLDFEKEVH